MQSIKQDKYKDKGTKVMIKVTTEFITVNVKLWYYHHSYKQKGTIVIKK